MFVLETLMGILKFWRSSQAYGDGNIVLVGTSDYYSSSYSLLWYNGAIHECNSTPADYSNTGTFSCHFYWQIIQLQCNL